MIIPFFHLFLQKYKSYRKKRLILILLILCVLGLFALFGKNKHFISNAIFIKADYFSNDSTKGGLGQNNPHLPKPPIVPFYYDFVYNKYLSDRCYSNILNTKGYE